MFGIDTGELLVLAIVALLFIGPKELPAAMRTLGRFIGKIRAYTRHFTEGIDNVVREAELEEMEKEWQRQNDAIMKRYPNVDAIMRDTPDVGEVPDAPPREELPDGPDKPTSAP